MKRVIAGVLALVLALAAGGAAWWFFFRGAPPSPAACLPAGTVFYVEIPDGAKTFLRYQGSRLRQIVEHPEARQLAGGAAALLRRAIPAGALDPGMAAHLEKAGSEFGLALGGTSFLAVTRIDVAPPAPGAKPDPRAWAAGIGAVGGFHASPGGGSHVDALVRELGALWKDAPAPGAGVHGAVAYTYVELPEAGVRLCRARWNGWDLFSFGEAPLFDFLDRAAGRGTGPALNAAAYFTATVPKVGAGADLVAYGAFEPLWSLYAGWMAVLVPGSDAAPIIDQLRFMKASAAGIAFRDGELVQRSVLLAPQAERGDLGSAYQPVPLATLRFATPSTVLYYAQAADLEAQLAWQKKVAAAAAKPGAPAPPSPFDMLEKQVASQGLDLHENFLRAVGPELALVVDWPAGQEIPDAMLVMAVKDAAKFGPFYDKYAGLAAATLGPMGKVETFEAGGCKAVSLATPMVPWASPTLFGGAEFWGLSLTASGAKRLLPAPGGGLTVAALTGSAGLPGQPCMACYLKTGEAVSRGYAALRPLLAAKLGQEGAGAALVAQLPAASQLAPLLGDLRMLGTVDGDFIHHSFVSPDGGLALVGAGLAAAEASLAAKKAPVPAAAPPVAPAPVPAAPPAAAPSA